MPFREVEHPHVGSGYRIRYVVGGKGSQSHLNHTKDAPYIERFYYQKKQGRMLSRQKQIPTISQNGMTDHRTSIEMVS